MNTRPPNQPLTPGELLAWLRETDPVRLETLWQRADAVRHAAVGDAVHLRGLLEISNHCIRACAYCGIRGPRTDLARYRLSADEILDGAQRAVRLGYGTLVLQAGEDPGLDAEWLARLIRQIKRTTPLAVTLSLGEREDAEFRLWKKAGADRYLLRFETSDPALFARIHPAKPGRVSDRIAILRRLRTLGYEIGSGVMVGIPGQTMTSLAQDIDRFRALDLDMIGVGPYLPHPDTPLGQGMAGGEGGGRGSLRAGPAGATNFRDPRHQVAGTPESRHPAKEPSVAELRPPEGAPIVGPVEGRALRARSDGLPDSGVAELRPPAPFPVASDQAPNTEEMVYKVIALTRLVCPESNIPSTTALATLNRSTGRELGLARGANVVMPNLTPVRYRALYELYPDKVCLAEEAEQCAACLRARIESLGRTIGTGPGGRKERNGDPSIDSGQAGR